MLYFRYVALAICSCLATSTSFASEQPLLVGSYAFDRMSSITPLTFPRVMLYGSNGELIERAAWPSALDRLKEKAGEAFCCVSDEPSPAGTNGPPPDCKPLIHGEDIEEHFKGLRDADGKSLEYDSLPEHKYLIVEYYADWCSPCHAARRELEAFLSSSASKGFIGLAIDFSGLETE